MQQVPQVKFRHMNPSPALEERILKKVAKLDRISSKITFCHVTVEQPGQGHHLQGNRFHITIQIGVPGTEIVISHEKRDSPSHEDPYTAVDDAFKAATRRLLIYKDKTTFPIKKHVPINAHQRNGPFNDEEYGGPPLGAPIETSKDRRKRSAS